MEIALTPMEFARRARRVYADREAVVDGELRLTYGQFFERCDRWSAALQAMGVRQGDRIAYIAPNTHAHLEAYYAVPQIGAVLVPINYRLLSDDFEYIINHCGAKVVCAHSDHIEAIESIRGKLTNVSHFVTLEGKKDGWIDYEATLAKHKPAFDKPEIGENDLLTINYTSGTTARPKGVMITHRNAYMNVIGTLAHHHLDPGDRYLWTGSKRTRPFAEFRLLGEIARLGLPGPVAVAARYVRHGLFYSADLITRRIADAQTLAECLAAGQLDGELAEKVGALVARFHRAGIWHADLNAHNVLVTPDGLYLIDFDRGRLRKPATAWRQANLQRLRRSLLKLGAAGHGEAVFEKDIWQPLLGRYGRTLTP